MNSIIKVFYIIFTFMKYIIWFSCFFLLSCKSDEDASLINKWKLDSYIKNSGSTVTLLSFPIHFVFEKDSTVKINLNVNTCNGEYTKSSKKLTLKNFNCTKNETPINDSSTIVFNKLFFNRDSLYRRKIFE